MPANEFTWREPEDDADRALLANVRDYGWHGVYIPGDAEGPGYGFTVGLFANFGHPELLLQDLDQKLTHSIFWGAVRQLQAGKSFAHGDVTDTLFGEHRAKFATVPFSAYQPNLGSAIWFYQPMLPKKFLTLQILWPDRSGRFPGDEGCDADCVRRQRLLGVPT